MKYFNTVGSIDPESHYFLPHRLDWEQLTSFIEKKYYFVLHAPRQSGKTTAIIEFAKHLNHEGKYTALYLSTESAHTAINDVAKATYSILSEIKRKIHITLKVNSEIITYLDNLLSCKPTAEDGLVNFLTFWAENTSKPLVLFFDEFDGLVGDSLISMLKQFRMGYTDRPKHFPQTICLIGVRDLRDYKVKTKQQEELGVLYSPFNIKAESLVLPNFSQEDVKTLYLQHTAETKQQFTDEAIEYAFQQTQGQPWLVNALAYQACFRDPSTTLENGHPDCSKTITKEVMENARDALIARQDTHLDALADRLSEQRVYKIIDTIIHGTIEKPMAGIDDIKYVQDLGLITVDAQNIRIANPIYQEILPRVLSARFQSAMSGQSVDYKNIDGSLDMCKLLEMFTEFYRENSATWLQDCNYQESGPHLLLMAFLQRVVNGGGKIGREYALGSKRVDLLVKFGQQKIVIELKVWYGPKAYQDGLEQTAAYMDNSNASEGHLVIFDRSTTKNWGEKIYHRQESIDGKKINVWGM